MEIIDRILDRDWRGDNARPASGVRPIVGADPRERRDGALNREPGSRRIVAARLQHHGWTAHANTREVQLAAVDIEQPVEASRLRLAPPLPPEAPRQWTQRATALPVAVAQERLTPVMRCGAVTSTDSGTTSVACRTGRSGAR